MYKLKMHINNIFREGEFVKTSVVAYFATTDKGVINW